MQRSLTFFAISLLMLASGCGGGGSTSIDTTAPVMTGLTATLPSTDTLRLTSLASDAEDVAGYCFKSTNTKPSSSDSCFQTSNIKDYALTEALALQYVWAKDDAGNVSSEPLRGPCSGAGLEASDAVSNNTVCMMTSLGEMVFELAPNEAPITTENFLKYVNDGFYAGTIFHRVISTFMVQGGGYDTSLTYKAPTYDSITLEAPSATGLSNTIGTVAMARTSVLDSATSQFFVNTVDNDGSVLNNLDTSGGGYAVFGHLISGSTTLDAIKAVTVVNNGGGEVSLPADPPVIRWVIQLK